MPDAWETLVANSTLSSGDAWAHLNAQQDGHQNVFLSGGIDVDIEPRKEDVNLVTEIDIAAEQSSTDVEFGIDIDVNIGNEIKNVEL
ncbi:MAG: hypothetical protein K6L81_01890 [Agarilytica sp.]